METSAFSTGPAGPAEGRWGSSAGENTSFGMYNECFAESVDFLVVFERADFLAVVDREEIQRSEERQGLFR